MGPSIPLTDTTGIDLKFRARKTAPSRLGILGLTALLIAMSGCASLQPSPTMPPSANLSSSPAAKVTELPEAKTTVDCKLSRPSEDPRPNQAADLVLGPLRYPGLLDGYPQGLPDAMDGIIFAKIGAHLTPDATVTVSIDPEVSNWASIVTEAGPPAGYLSVTYKSCPAHLHPEGSWYVGGFALRNQTSGCLALNVQVHGEASIRRTVISFGDKVCT